jgi:pimeloyl-ACP methyl ester carboxylesterase
VTLGAFRPHALLVALLAALAFAQVAPFPKDFHAREASTNGTRNEFAADPEKIDEATRKHYAKLYAQPGAMHAALTQFAAFDQDAKDNQTFLATGKLAMPVPAAGGDHSFGPTMAVVMRAAATNVREKVVADSGHWLMEGQPGATMAAVEAFLSAAP